MQSGASPSSAFPGRFLIALVCACALTFGLVAQSQARGAHATRLPVPQQVAIIAATGQTAPAPAAAPCPFAVLVAGVVPMQEGTLSKPSATSRALLYALVHDAATPLAVSGGLFRPPRTA